MMIVRFIYMTLAILLFIGRIVFPDYKYYFYFIIIVFAVLFFKSLFKDHKEHGTGE